MVRSAPREGERQESGRARELRGQLVHQRPPAADDVSLTSDDISTVCLDATGNTVSPAGNIFLDRRLAGATLSITQASLAALQSANTGMTVSPPSPVGVTGNVACNPTLPANG